MSSIYLQDYFKINLSTGQISVQSELDRETAEKIVMEVVVEDKNAMLNQQTGTG